jgi:hypothetical protein
MNYEISLNVINIDIGVGATGTGKSALEEQKIYHRNYAVYVYILAGCITGLFALRYQGWHSSNCLVALVKK